MLRNYLSDQPTRNLLGEAQVLVVLPYGATCKPGVPGVINTGLTALGNQPVNEVWSVNHGSVVRGISGNCHWSKTSEILCVATWLSPEDCQDLQASTERAYTELLTQIQNQGYPFPFRFWNYIPDINLGAGDNEHYKLFCAGRLNAFRTMAITEDHFPSASALGHHAEGAVIYAFAAKIPGQHHSNTLQVNAYQYPREYGVSSPSFSRATGITLEQKRLFLISGTASIIGHKTTSEGDLRGQLNTTVNNIQHLLACKANQNLSLQSMKVYLRHASDYLASQVILQTHFPDTLMIFTLADICRKNLLVEVECFCG